MRDVTVRPVQFEDEPTSTVRRTRTRAVTLRSGEPIQVEVDGRWVNAWILGSAHSELRVTLRPPEGHHRHLTMPDQDDPVTPRG